MHRFCRCYTVELQQYSKLLGTEDKVVTGDICFLVRVQLSESYLCARHFTAHDFFYLIYIDKSMQQLPETMLAAELSYVFLSRFHFQI